MRPSQQCSLSSENQIVIIAIYLKEFFLARKLLILMYFPRWNILVFERLISRCPQFHPHSVQTGPCCIPDNLDALNTWHQTRDQRDHNHHNSWSAGPTMQSLDWSRNASFNVTKYTSSENQFRDLFTGEFSWSAKKVREGGSERGTALVRDISASQLSASRLWVSLYIELSRGEIQWPLPHQHHWGPGLSSVLSQKFKFKM